MRFVVVVAVLASGCFTEAPPVGSDGSDGSDGTSTTSDVATTEGGPADTSTMSGSAEAESSSAMTSGSTTDVAPECGNGEVEGSEECDDGNAMQVDGCTAACVIGPRPLRLELVPPPPVVGASGVVSATESCETGDGQTRALAGLGGWRGGVDAGNAWTVSARGGCQQIAVDPNGETIALAPDPTMLAEHGNNVGQIDQWMLQCPAGAVPIGIDSRVYAGDTPNIVAVRVQCGMPVLDPAAQTGMRVEPLQPSPWTMAAASNDERSSMCPTDTIAVGFRGDFNAADAAIYTLGALCAQPVVPFGPE